MENKPILNIAFHGFWDTNEIIFEHYFKNSHRFLFNKYDVRVVTDVNDANVLFCSTFGNFGGAPPPATKCSKVMMVHENILPGSSWFEVYDYVISFATQLTFRPNHFRIPYWAYRFFEHDLNLDDVQNRKNTDADALYESRRFCNFVYSNSFFFRREFAHKLSSYQRVDFGGKVDTNIPDAERSDITVGLLGTAGLAQKSKWLSKYRFTIAFENSSTEGYTTEKIIDAFVANTIPLYWGNLRIRGDGFNPESFLNYFETPGDENFIRRIREVNESKQAYMDIINKPLFTNPPEYINPNYMLKLYDDMFEHKIAKSAHV